jgi:hypothetical protein
MKKSGTRFGNFVGGGVFIIAGGLFLSFLVSNAVDVVRLRLQPPIVFRVVNTEIVPADSGKSVIPMGSDSNGVASRYFTFAFRKSLRGQMYNL